MIQMRTNLDVADNSGAKTVQCIKVLGGSRRKYASIGDIIVVSVKVALPRRGVKVGFTPKTIATSTDSVAVRWRRTLPPSLGWLAAFGADADYVWSDGKTTAEHGTPNALSRSVPIAFMGASVAKVRYDRLVRTVDIAPTLAMLIGVEPSEPLDGSALKEVKKP